MKISITPRKKRAELSKNAYHITITVENIIYVKMKD